MSRNYSPNGSLSYMHEQPWFVLNATQNYYLMLSDNPMISHFYSFKVEDSGGHVLAIPDGCVDILFDCCRRNPSARICGTPLNVRNFDLIKGNQYFGVRFSPGVIPYFRDIGAQDLIENEIGIFDVLPMTMASEAFEKIINAQSIQAQSMIFSDEIASHLSYRFSKLTHDLLRIIQRSRGNLQVNELEAMTGYTSRTIQRQFRKDTGMSPKTFSRIVRCQFAINILNVINDVSFLNLAMDLGFSDQPHFQREFKSLVSTTPRDYSRRVNHNAYSERLRYT